MERETGGPQRFTQNSPDMDLTRFYKNRKILDCDMPQYWTIIRCKSQAIFIYLCAILLFMGELGIRFPYDYSFYQYIEVVLILLCGCAAFSHVREAFQLYMNMDNMIRGKPKTPDIRRKSSQQLRTFTIGELGETFSAREAPYTYRVVQKTTPKRVPKKRYGLDGCFHTEEELHEYLAQFEEKKRREEEERKNLQDEWVNKRAIRHRLEGELYAMPYRYSCAYPVFEDKIETKQRLFLVANAKLFIFHYIVNRLNIAIMSLDMGLSRLHTDNRVSNTSIETMKSYLKHEELVQNHLSTLPLVLSCLDFGYAVDTAYIVDRIRLLPRILLNFELQQYYLANEVYNELKPSDIYIIFKLFCNIMDIEMGRTQPGQKIFTKTYTIVNDGGDLKLVSQPLSKNSLLIYCSNRIDPKFSLAQNGEWKSYPEHDGLYRLLIDFLHHVRYRLKNKLGQFEAHGLTTWLSSRKFYMSMEDFSKNCN